MASIDEQEKEILGFWRKDKTFEKSLKKNPKTKPYVFYDGPPFATGLPHYGHILASVLKDAIPRFWTMNGKYVRRVWGWDCHGLPIENIAEAELKIKTKDEIEKMGVKKFNDFCRSKVLTYVSEWKKTVERIGRWTEFDNSYKTMDNDYIESVWWAFKKLYDKGLIYEGEKILMYCPRCETPLSKSEIAMDNSYKNVKDQSVTVKFKLKDENAYVLAWTTTPWTLPFNLGVMAHPDIEYVKCKVDNEYWIVAKARADAVMNAAGKEYTVKKLTGDKGNKYVCENVLLYVLEGSVKIGKPYLKEIKVECEIVSQKKDVKVNTFRYTAKSRFRKRVGSRALITRLLIKKFVTATK